MLFRMVDIPLDDYPLLSWDWLIEQGIDAEFDEMTSAGDDHPARFFLTFQTTDGKDQHMEIVWGNDQLKAGAGGQRQPAERRRFIKFGQYQFFKPLFRSFAVERNGFYQRILSEKPVKIIAHDRVAGDVRVEAAWSFTVL